VPSAVGTIVCGHTQMPFMRVVNRRLVINSGSVGMPYGRAGGTWALLKDGDVSLRFTPVDIEAAIDSVIAGSTFPNREECANYFLRATAGDAEALTAFAPRDGRHMVEERLNSD